MAGEPARQTLRTDELDPDGGATGVAHSRGWRRARRRKSGAERRAQYNRAHARSLQVLLRAFDEVSRHRGGQCSRLAKALMASLNETDGDLNAMDVNGGAVDTPSNNAPLAEHVPSTRLAEH